MKNLLSTSLILIIAILPALADSQFGSLDNIWSDQSSSNFSGQVKQEKMSAAGMPVSTAAPLCALEDFNGSTLMRTGGWPGLGPFKAEAGSPNSLFDQSGNRINLAVADGHVTSAELKILKGKPVDQDFLDIEMAADFLLEAVGAKAKKIAQMNLEMEKAKEQILFKSDLISLHFDVGHYLVSLEKQHIAAGDQAELLVRVDSKDASKDVLREHSAVSGQPVNPAPSSAAYDKTTAATAHALKDDFQNVIETWQKIKKSVVRHRQVEPLTEVLAGNALKRQAEAIKWLINNHKYYDMVPLGVHVDYYQELVPGTKCAVFAKVKESSKLIDETSGKVIKESSDTYKVNYTMERINGHWLITDSAIVNAKTVLAPASQTSAVSH